MDALPLDRLTEGLVTMSKWYRGDTRPPQVALEKILYYFRRVNRPIYLGSAALEVGYALSPTEAMFEVLEESGLIRPLTILEKRNLGVDERGSIYVLTDKARSAASS